MQNPQTMQDQHSLCPVVVTDQQLTQQAWEAQVAHHVEALIGLGWHWEGRSLAPGWEPWHAQGRPS